MNTKFIEITDRTNHLYLINVNHIVSVTKANDAISIRLTKDSSILEIFSKMTLEEFKALL